MIGYCANRVIEKERKDCIQEKTATQSNSF
jgi:hypothetical protein